MQRGWQWGPRQQVAVDRALAVVGALRAAADAQAARQVASDAGLLGTDVAVERGGGGGSLLEALAVAEALGEHLPRHVGAALWEGAPVRVLATLEKGRAMLPQVLKGQTVVALLDVTSAPVRLERRPGVGSRLTGDVPPTVVPLDARFLLVVFEERADWYSVALLPANHAALRVEPLDGLPLGLMSGVLDVQVADEDAALDVSLEVLRALASEELLRAARGVGEAHAALGTPAATGPGWDTLTVARTALHAAAERLLDVGSYTLLGEEARYGPAAGALEARALARKASADVVGVLHRTHASAEGLQPGLHAALDVALSAPYDVVRGVWFKLGDARQGALFASRTRPPLPSRADSRTPLPADAEGRTSPPGPASSRSQVPGRATTSRMQGVHVEWGPLPFVPDDVRRVQMEARQLVLEQLEPLSLTLDREGSLPPSAWDVLGTRGLLGLGVPSALGGAGLGLRALCCALEETGRTHPLWGHTVEHNGLAAWALAQGLPPAIVEAHLPSLLNATVRANVLFSGDSRLGDGGFSGEARGDGRRDAGLWLVNSPTGVVLLGPRPPGMELPVSPTAVERDLPEALGVTWSHAVPLAWMEGVLPSRLVQAQQLTATARLCGVTAHVLELWRASLQGRPDASRVTQVQRLGQAWTALAQVRAVLWSAVMRVDGGEDAAAPAGAACRSARLMCVGTLERALHGAGVEALRSRSRLRDHLKTARRLGATLATRS